MLREDLGSLAKDVAVNFTKSDSSGGSGGAMIGCRKHIPGFSPKVGAAHSILAMDAIGM